MNADRLRLWKAFDDFDRSNPHVWELFQRYTFDLIRAGRTRYSARTVVERIRWDAAILTIDVDGLKINNNYSPFYSAKFRWKRPEHAAFFAERKKSKDVDDERCAASRSDVPAGVPTTWRCLRHALHEGNHADA